MIRSNFKFLQFIVFIYTLFILSSINCIASNFKILAYVNEKAITERDVVMFMKITKNNDRKKALKEYVDLINHYEIARKTGVGLTRKEKKENWSIFSAKFKTNQSKSEFCKKNNIDESFLDEYMKMVIIWERYSGELITKNVNIRRETIVEKMKLEGKAKTEKAYELSEIVLNYSNTQQKNEVRKRINSILDDINHGKTSFANASKNNSSSKTVEDNGYIGWSNESDFTEKISTVLRKTNNGNITEPICVGNDKGTCLIFFVHNSKDVMTLNEKEEANTFSDFYKKIVETKTAEIVSSYDNSIKVKYN